MSSHPKQLLSIVKRKADVIQGQNATIKFTVSVSLLQMVEFFCISIGKKLTIPVQQWVIARISEKIMLQDKKVKVKMPSLVWHFFDLSKTYMLEHTICKENINFERKSYVLVQRNWAVYRTKENQTLKNFLDCTDIIANVFRKCSEHGESHRKKSMLCYWIMPIRKRPWRKQIFPACYVWRSSVMA